MLRNNGANIEMIVQFLVLYVVGAGKPVGWIYLPKKKFSGVTLSLNFFSEVANKQDLHRVKDPVNI